MLYSIARTSKVWPAILIALFPLSALAITTYQSAPQAQSQCPHDTVVWLNLPTGIFHYADGKWYGHTKHGAYVCEKAAIAAGDRASFDGS
jgi:hypothetical protein